MVILNIALKRWKIVGTIIGGVNARLLMMLVYVTVIPIFGIANTYFADPLRIKKPTFDGVRLERRPVGETLEDARKQY